MKYETYAKWRRLGQLWYPTTVLTLTAFLIAFAILEHLR